MNRLPPTKILASCMAQVSATAAPEDRRSATGTQRGGCRLAQRVFDLIAMENHVCTT